MIALGLAVAIGLPLAVLVWAVFWPQPERSNQTQSDFPATKRTLAAVFDTDIAPSIDRSVVDPTCSLYERLTAWNSTVQLSVDPTLPHSSWWATGTSLPCTTAGSGRITLEIKPPNSPNNQPRRWNEMNLSEICFHLKNRRRMYVFDDRYLTSVAFVTGFDQAHDGSPLSGFQTFVIDRLFGGKASSLHWAFIIARCEFSSDLDENGDLNINDLPHEAQLVLIDRMVDLLIDACRAVAEPPPVE